MAAEDGHSAEADAEMDAEALNPAAMAELLHEVAMGRSGGPNQAAMAELLRSFHGRERRGERAGWWLAAVVGLEEEDKRSGLEKKKKVGPMQRA
jgi:hypothetical protein